MKKRFIHAIYILFVLVLTVAMISPQPAVLANTTTEKPNPMPGQDQPGPGQDMLIVLPVEPPDPEQFNRRLSRLEAKEFANQMTYVQAAPLLAELERLRDEGVLSGFEVRPNLHGIVIQVVDAERFALFSNLPAVAAVLPMEGQPPECASASAETLIGQVEGISQIASLRQFNSASINSGIQATDPSIFVYRVSDWNDVYGKTSPHTAVNLRVIRGGSVLATARTTSYNDGYYYFYPKNLGCPFNTPEWTLLPGDVVEVSANGKTYSTMVVHLSAWMDPFTNRVSGITVPGGAVEIDVIQPNRTDLCSGSTLHKMTTRSDPGGNFSADLSSLVDFDSSAYADVRTVDANGNGMVVYPHAYDIVVNSSQNDVYGVLKPNSSYTLILWREDSAIVSFSGTTSAEGWYFEWYDQSFQAGDIIEVSGGGVTMQYTIAPLKDLVINPNTDQISGVTTAGGRIRTDFQKSVSFSYYQSFPTSCDYGYSCGFQVASGGGNFTIQSSDMDLVRGDWIDLRIYDKDGNYQRHSLKVPAIYADTDTQQVRGVWSTTQGPSLTIIHTNSGGTVKSTYTDIGISFWDNSFYKRLATSIEPGDRFVVNDGTTTETMIIPATLPTARLNSSTGRLTSSLPAGSTDLMVILVDYRQAAETYDYDSFCVERSVGGGGSFDLSFDGAQVNGGDRANIYIRNADGHYTQLIRNAFVVSIWQWQSFSSVEGYTETPNTRMTAALRRGDAILETVEANSSNTGYWWPPTFNAYVQVGDRIELSTADGNNVNLDIPQLTFNMDAANNRIFGKSPANQPAVVHLYRHFKKGFIIISQMITGDSVGNYSASFNNHYFDSYLERCAAASVGHRCARGGLSYYTPAGHGIFVVGEKPLPAAADSFENDDSMTNATPYTVLQTHTFHTEDDEDWVSFTVPTGDVMTNHYKIYTLNEGWGTATNLELFHSDGELIQENPGWDGIDWLSNLAGTYYVRITTPWSIFNAAHCDAFYDLMILPVRGQIFLPLVKR